MVDTTASTGILGDTGINLSSDPLLQRSYIAQQPISFQNARFPQHPVILATVLRCQKQAVRNRQPGGHVRRRQVKDISSPLSARANASSQ